MTNEEFANAPDTLAFLTRDSQRVWKYLNNETSGHLTIEMLAGYLTILISEEDYHKLPAEYLTGITPAHSSLLGLLGMPALDEAGITSIQNNPYLSLRGQGTFIGIIDTGIDFTLEAFQYEDGTSKIAYLWDQTIPGSPPDGFFIGSEYNNQQINEAIKSPNPFDVVPHRDTVGHGTFLASVAASRENGRYIGAAPDADLIVVKLKEASEFYKEMFLIPEWQENAYESTLVALAIEYMYKRSQIIGKPISICLGMGTNTGSHDGLSMFEEYMGAMAHRQGVCICAAAGNESQSRHHTTAIVKEKESVPVEIRVGESPSNIFLSIWSGPADRLSVSIISPAGEFISRVPPQNNSTYQTTLVLERSSITVKYFFPVDRNGGQETVVGIKNATPGIWTINVIGDVVLEGQFHAWLPITGQVEPSVQFLNPDSNDTVTIPGTSVGTISCGAYDMVNGSLYFDSSWGPTKYPFIAPDLTAPGVNVAGIYPTGYGTMTGTSVSAALTTGACSLLMQWGFTEGNDTALNTYRIKSYLIRGCDREARVIYPNNQWGYGKLDLFNTFELMRTN